MSELAIYYDASKCSACKGCQIMCKQWNQLPSPMTLEEMPYTGSFENPPHNDGDTWLRIKFTELDVKGETKWAFGRDACHHCTNAACVAACPTGACHKLDNGATVIDSEKCIGCKYCVAACPFEIPKYRERNKKTFKCWMCQDRIENGLTPGCTSTCPTSSLDFGDRKEMLAKAKARAAELKPTHPDVIVYGENEMGGLHVIHVLPFGAKAHGLPENPKEPVTATLSNIVKPLTALGVVGMLGVVTASFIGGRGYKRGEDELHMDVKVAEEDMARLKKEDEKTSKKGGE